MSATSTTKEVHKLETLSVLWTVSVETVPPVVMCFVRSGHQSTVNYRCPYTYKKMTVENNTKVDFTLFEELLFPIQNEEA